jgi:hypothetical protein
MLSTKARIAVNSVWSIGTPAVQRAPHSSQPLHGDWSMRSAKA